MSGKLLGFIVLLVLLLIFAVQNTQPVAMKFLFWDWTTSVTIMILITFGVGFLFGLLVSILRPKKKKAEDLSPSFSPENRKT